MVRLARWWVESISTSFGTWRKPKEGTTIRARLGDTVDVVVCAELDEVPKDPNTYVQGVVSAYVGRVVIDAPFTIWFGHRKAGCAVARLHLPSDPKAFGRFWIYPVGAVRQGKLVKPIHVEMELQVSIGKVAVPKPLRIQPIAPQPQPPPHKETVAL